MESMVEHWNSIYSNKQPNEVSWTQEYPATSLDFIRGFNLPKTASIIDVGGGESRLVDCLLDAGYANISVLDISGAALERVKARLGERAEKVKWIVSDITEFKPDTTYDVWHDRATFHFLTRPDRIEKYLNIAGAAVSQYLIVGTFSENGPTKCSGLAIKQYKTNDLQELFSEKFQSLRCITEDHLTPFYTKQNFLFCSFEKKQA